MSLRRLTLNTAAMSTVTLLRMLVQTLSVPVLARFLSPEDYGIVALAMPFVLFAMMFADAGMGVSLVRTPLTHHQSWSTSFWVTLLLGGFLTLAIIGAGFLATLFFEEPQLCPVVAALSAVVFLQAVATVPGAALQQQHRFGVIAVIEIAAMLGSIAAAFTTAVQGGGVWALVAQQLTHYIIKLILTFPCSHFRPRFLFTLEATKEHLLFGRDFMGANFITFLTQSADNFVIGKMLGAASVGVYSMAFLFARLPSRIVSGPLQFVLYPYLTQLRDNTTLMGSLFLFLTRALAIIILPGMGMIAVAYHPIFTVVLSEKWAASGQVFMLVAPAVALQTVTALRGTLIMALGRSDIMLRQAIEYGIAWGLLLVIASFWGLEAVAIAYSVMVFLYFPRSTLMVLRPLSISFFHYIRSMLPSLGITAVCIGVYLCAAAEMSEDWWKLGLAVLLAIVAIGASAWVQYMHLLTGIKTLKELGTHIHSAA